MAAKTSIDEFQLTAPIRLLNRVGSLLDHANIKPVRLSLEALMAEASRQTGFSDWGESQFLEDYAVLVSAFENHPTLSLLGRLGMQREFLRLLTNRLSIQQIFKDSPEAANVPITRPMFILGLPRTGTTLLHKLLGQDPKMRVPPLWQLLTPTPLSHLPTPQQRIRNAEQFVKLANFAAPMMRTMHSIDTYEPEECLFLLPHHLAYHWRADIPQYKTWFLERNAAPDYQYHKQQLQCLAWEQKPQHWVMKCPFHLFTLDALLRVYPDACIVQTHRELSKVIPSWCSFGVGIQTLHLKQVNRMRMGEEWVKMWKTGIERTTTVRETANPAQFFDLHYTDFVADPVEWVKQIYRHFGHEMEKETETRMRSWLNSQTHEPSAHRYAAEQFGLDENQIRDTFQSYSERFGIQPEG